MRTYSGQDLGAGDVDSSGGGCRFRVVDGLQRYLRSRITQKFPESQENFFKKLYWMCATPPAVGWESGAPERLGNMNKRYKSSTTKTMISSHLPSPPQSLGENEPKANKDAERSGPFPPPSMVSTDSFGVGAGNTGMGFPLPHRE